MFLLKVDDRKVAQALGPQRIIDQGCGPSSIGLRRSSTYRLCIPSVGLPSRCTTVSRRPGAAPIFS
jgi:hypothetical protein